MTQIKVQEIISNEVDQVKELITSALFGSTSPQESIEMLSELLYPGENLLQNIQNQKVIIEITKRLSAISESGLVIHSIEKESEGFIANISFANVNTFLSVQSKIMGTFKQIASHYQTTIIPNFQITETVKG